MEHIFTHLKKDKKLCKAIEIATINPLVLKTPIYLYLCKNILGQQLNIKVAALLFERFLKLFHNTNKPSLQQIASLDFDTLKSIGLSFAKTNYILNICNYFIENKITDKKLMNATEEEIIELLIPIKGVGLWTIEMLLMFALQKENVFSVDDLGIQQGMCNLYNIKYETKKEMKEKMKKIASKWSPYSTYACLAIWQWKDK